MKILTKKKQKEILKCIAANRIIAEHYIEDVDAFEHTIDNTLEITNLVAGISGMKTVANIVDRYNQKKKISFDEFLEKYYAITIYDIEDDRVYEELFNEYENMENCE